MRRHPESNPRPRRPGFTLVEAVVVIAILAVLVGLLLSAVQKARASAARAGCASNLRQVAVAVLNYESGRGRRPPGCDGFSAYGIGWSWQTAVLADAGEEPLWTRAWQARRADPVGTGPPHRAVERQVVPVYLCPADGRRTGSVVDAVWALTGYRGVAGTRRAAKDGLFHEDLAVRMVDITDGTSNTIAVGERGGGPAGAAGGWYSAWGDNVCPVAQILPADRAAEPPFGAVGCPADAPAFRPGRPDDLCGAVHFWSRHPGGAHFAFADGSVRFLRYAAADVLPALATRAGGESVPPPD